MRSLVCYWQYVIIGSDNVLAPIRRQDIMWMNSNIVHRRLYASLSLNVNTLRPGQNGRRFADDTLECIFLNENIRISIKISLKFVPEGPINNIPALVQKMAWRRLGDKPLSEPMGC